jgi:uncharacterized protein involved in outer membrane biogenesis
MRWKWIVTIGVLVIACLIATVYVVLNTYDYNKLKPLVARMVEEATGRKLSLSGEVNLEIGLMPTLVVTNIALANVSWGSQPQMIEIEKLQAQVRLLPLLHKDVEVNQIGLFGVKVLLETDANGQDNWNFPAADSDAGSPGAQKPVEIDIERVTIENLHLTFNRQKTDSQTQFTLESLAMNRQETEDALALKLQADVDGQAVMLSGKTGGVRQLLSHERFPLQLSGSLANAAIEINGAIDDLLNLQGIELAAQLIGKNVATLAPYLNIRLPKTKAFEVNGVLKGSKESLMLENVKGNLSGSSFDLAVSGSISDVIAISGVDLKLISSGKDLAEFGQIIGEKLPVTDGFTVQGRLTGSAQVLSLSEAKGTARHGDLSLVCDGGIKDFLNFSEIDLTVKGSGKDLSDIGSIIGEKIPVTDEFVVQGRLMGSTKALSLLEAAGSASRGSLNLTVSGAIKELLALEGINVKLKASGKELADIGPLLGTDLPELGSFDVSGKLSGSTKTISLNDLSVMVDKSDFNGQAKVVFLKRPNITLHLQSSVIDFTALMKSLEQDEEKTTKKDKQTHRLFSDDPLPFDVLKKVDADIRIEARNVHVKDARLKFGLLSLKLDDGALRINKLEATYKDTKISGNMQLTSGSSNRVATRFLVQNLDLGGFFRESGINDQIQAIVDLAAHLNGRGDSVHSLVANLEGEIGAVMGEGYLTKYLDLISFNLSQKVVNFWGRPKDIDQIKCAVVQFDIKSGVAASQAFVFDTRAGILTGEGEINLGTEKVDFLLVPKPKHPGLIEFSTKLRVRGTILDAKVSPAKLALVETGVRALGSLVTGPLRLLTPFVHLGAHEKHPCEIQSIGQLGLQSP